MRALIGLDDACFSPWPPFVLPAITQGCSLPLIDAPCRHDDATSRCAHAADTSSSTIILLSCLHKTIADYISGVARRGTTPSLRPPSRFSRRLLYGTPVTCHGYVEARRRAEDIGDISGAADLAWAAAAFSSSAPALGAIASPRRDA